MAVADKQEKDKLDNAVIEQGEAAVIEQPKQVPFEVRATQLGYYGQLREEGDTFEIYGEEAFSDTWMQKVTK